MRWNRLVRAPRRPLPRKPNGRPPSWSGWPDWTNLLWSCPTRRDSCRRVEPPASLRSPLVGHPWHRRPTPCDPCRCRTCRRRRRQGRPAQRRRRPRRQAGRNPDRHLPHRRNRPWCRATRLILLHPMPKIPRSRSRSSAPTCRQPERRRRSWRLARGGALPSSGRTASSSWSPGRPSRPMRHAPSSRSARSPSGAPGGSRRFSWCSRSCRIDPVLSLSTNAS